MPALCDKCRNEDLSVWDTHRVAELTTDFFGKPIKIVKYLCNECLGHGENIHTNNYHKEKHHAA